MAKGHAPADSDTGARARIALECTWQIAGLFDELIKRGLEIGGTGNESAVIRALAIRGKRLNSAAMAMLGDELAPIDGAMRVVSDESSAAPHTGSVRSGVIRPTPRLTRRGTADQP